MANELEKTPASYLRQEYEQNRKLFEAQSPTDQYFLGQQALRVLDEMRRSSPRIRFTLPAQVVVAGDGSAAEVPASMRNQVSGSWLSWKKAGAARHALKQSLFRLEQDPHPAIAASGRLLRFALARTAIYLMISDGHTVKYHGAPGEIPCEPGESLEPASLTAAEDAIAEGDADTGRLQVPYVPYARRFFLPQWVAFDEQDELLAGSVAEAEAAVASMQAYLEMLHQALAIAPYMVVDETCQRKRAGILGQLVNQGRALARFHTREIIATISKRALANNLNRGVRISLPYFDDQLLTMKTLEMEVVPGGRIQFLGAFMVRAVWLESAKVAQDTRLSESTRMQLLKQLEMLEKAFRNFSVK
ncbi:MAG: hypothetical protein CVU44_11540 [Chloroflexi bacterium HGW-Chloroflexi-6]|nr:MAG: hypothetical protein CVU44_11540 [Chloroflexi bacterium HGW-Chloroflexi-6]